MNGSVHDQSSVYLRAERSRKPLTRQGNLKGEETYRAYVESPARWGYAITMESEKSSYKCQQIKAKYQQDIAKYNQIFAESSSYDQMYIKHEQTCEFNSSMNDQHTKNKTRFIDQERLTRTPSDNQATTHALYAAEMKCMMSRGRRVSKCRLHSCRNREREPSRIPDRKVIRLFRKTTIVRNVAKLYFKKCIPNSCKLKLMLYEYNRHHFRERFGRSKCVLSSKKCFVRRNLYISVVRLRTLKHKKSPLFCMYVDEGMLKVLKQCQLQTYHVAQRVLSLSGDMEENPGPSHQCSVNTNLSDTNSAVSLLESRLSALNRTALDVGGGGDCFFRAVSHQLYGNPSNHFHVRSLGVQYLEQYPEQFIESNTESSWQDYLNNMSCQGTWADAIIIQAVANCLNLSIYIAESNESFVPVTVVQPMNMTRGCTNTYIGHIGEIHYVSTAEERSSELNNKQCSQKSVEDKVVIDKNEKRRAYIKEYMKKRRADAEFRKKENESLRQRRYNNIEKTKAEQRRAATKRKMTNLEQVRENDKRSFRKRKAENPEHLREIGKKSFRKRKEENPEHIRKICKKSFRKRKTENPEHIREIQKQGKRKQRTKNPEHMCSRQANKNAKVRKTVANLHATAPPAEMLFQDVQNIRLMNESQTIPIKLKRRLSYKHNYQFQNVRPKKVLDAAKYLVDTSDLFKSEGVEVQSTWLDNISLQSNTNDEWSEFFQNPDTSSGDLQTYETVEKDETEDCQNSISTTDVDNTCTGNEKGDNDCWCEVDERPSGVTDTLLQEADIAENADRIISFAPGEGNKPLGIFMDKYSEYLSFPTIFCGKRRP